jgi:hypothetical protein
MNPTHILVFTAFALFFGWAVPSRWRGWVLLGSSVIAIYWLQPSTPLRNFDFWFPTASIALTIFVWVVTRERNANSGRKTLIAALVVTGIVLLLGITRYIDFLCCLTPSRPPDLSRIALIVGLIAGCRLDRRRGCHSLLLSTQKPLPARFYYSFHSQPFHNFKNRFPGEVRQRRLAYYYRSIGRACQCLRPAMAGILFSGVSAAVRSERLPVRQAPLLFIE